MRDTSLGSLWRGYNMIDSLPEPHGMEKEEIKLTHTHTHLVSLVHLITFRQST